MQCTNKQETTSEQAYIFYYFEGKAQEKARLYSAYSYDLKNWKPLTAQSYQPSIGEYKVFRDPTVIQAADGIFHIVWTCGSSGFGMPTPRMVSHVQMNGLSMWKILPEE